MLKILINEEVKKTTIVIVKYSVSSLLFIILSYVNMPLINYIDTSQFNDSTLLIPVMYIGFNYVLTVVIINTIKYLAQKTKLIKRINQDIIDQAISDFHL